VSPGGAAARAAWFAYWDLMRRYHRFEVRGLEHVERSGPALLVGYHGRPIAHDLCMLQALLHERRRRSPGRGVPEPRPVIHEAFDRVPVLRWLVEGVGFVTGDGEAMARTIARGDPIIVTPGGTREGCRSSRERYRVAWGDRVGYVRLALRYRLKIIPTAATGVDDTYFAVNDGYAWGKRLGLPAKLPAWLGVGPLGLWPLSPPFPMKITQHIGAPIDLDARGPVDPADRGALLALHRQITGAVQALLDDARSGDRAARAPGAGRATSSGPLSAP
jgi:1-acyl-sn-glycerol-3-phosphate acyltransferase